MTRGRKAGFGWGTAAGACASAAGIVSIAASNTRILFIVCSSGFLMNKGLYSQFHAGYFAFNSGAFKQKRGTVSHQTPNPRDPSMTKAATAKHVLLAEFCQHKQHYNQVTTRALMSTWQAILCGMMLSWTPNPVLHGLGFVERTNSRH
jgi:hypothetical protein